MSLISGKVVGKGDEDVIAKKEDVDRLMADRTINKHQLPRGFAFGQLGIFFARTFLYVMVITVTTSVILLGLHRYIIQRTSVSSECEIDPSSSKCMDERTSSTIVETLLYFLQFGIMFTSFFMIMSHIGVSSIVLTVLSGILSAMIGLAGHPILQDYLFGFMKISDKQFAVGDWVDVCTSGSANNIISGVVHRINPRRIVLKDVHNRLTFISYSKILYLTNSNHLTPTVRVDFTVSHSVDVGTLFRAGNIACTNLYTSHKYSADLIDKPSVLGVNGTSEHSYILTLEAKCKRGTQFSTRRNVIKEGLTVLQTLGISSSITNINMINKQ